VGNVRRAKAALRKKAAHRKAARKKAVRQSAVPAKRVNADRVKKANGVPAKKGNGVPAKKGNVVLAKNGNAARAKREDANRDQKVEGEGAMMRGQVARWKLPPVNPLHAMRAARLAPKNCGPFAGRKCRHEWSVRKGAGKSGAAKYCRRPAVRSLSGLVHPVRKIVDRTPRAIWP